MQRSIMQEIQRLRMKIMEISTDAEW